MFVSVENFMDTINHDKSVVQVRKVIQLFEIVMGTFSEVEADS